MARYRRAKPLSFLKYRSKQLSHNSFASEAEFFFILTVCLHKVQLYKEKKKKTVYFSLQTGTSHSGKIFY